MRRSVCCLLVLGVFLTWKWKQYFPPKRQWNPVRIHGITAEYTVGLLFIVTAVSTSKTACSPARELQAPLRLCVLTVAGLYTLFYKQFVRVNAGSDCNTSLLWHLMWRYCGALGCVRYSILREDVLWNAENQPPHHTVSESRGSQAEPCLLFLRMFNLGNYSTILHIRICSKLLGWIPVWSVSIHCDI